MLVRCGIPACGRSDCAGQSGQGGQSGQSVREVRTRVKLDMRCGQLCFASQDELPGGDNRDEVSRGRRQ